MIESSVVLLCIYTTFWGYMTSSRQPLYSEKVRTVYSPTREICQEIETTTIFFSFFLFTITVGKEEGD